MLILIYLQWYMLRRAPWPFGPGVGPAAALLLQVAAIQLLLAVTGLLLIVTGSLLLVVTWLLLVVAAVKLLKIMDLRNHGNHVFGEKR